MRNLIQLYKNRGQILEGVQNSIFKKEHVEQIATERMQICLTCPALDLNGGQCAVPGSQPCCAECGCSLTFKTRALAANCPLRKWEAVLTSAEDELVRVSLETDN